MTGVPEKKIFQSVTVYYKNVYCQWNLTAQIEPVEDKFRHQPN